MGHVSEEIEIAAPAKLVWHAVHEDFDNAHRWTSGLKKVDILTPGPTRKGTRLRYHIETPAGVQESEVEHTIVKPDEVCAGDFIKGPLKGKWKYTYSPAGKGAGKGTRLQYTMDYEPNGFAMKLVMGMVDRQLPLDIRKTLASLKKYVEAKASKPPAKAAAVKRSAS